MNTGQKTVPLGITIRRDGQPYTAVGDMGYVNRFGEPGIVQHWVSACPECGADFPTYRKAGLLPDIRRCALHRKPGKRVAK